MQDLLDILCCPETHQPFQLADAQLIADLNAKIKAGQIKNRDGKVVTEPVEAGLVRQDRKYHNAVRNNIPLLLIDEAIPL